MPLLPGNSSLIRRAIALLPLVMVFAGCSSDPPKTEGPAAPAAVKVNDATFGGVASRRILTDHYQIETTLQDVEMIDRLAQVMEGAFQQYRKLAPDVTPSQSRMQCFVFESRNQWEQFTERHTGDDAKIYLRINRGGYAIGDWYVSYFIGDRETLSVAAHEGFHQYVGRHFKRRPPPFLEEGLSTLFEYVEFDGDLPRWTPGMNPTRANALVRALRDGRTLPLSKLCTMHAGQVVSGNLAQVEAFYAQAWAFARFCQDAEGARYRPGLQRMLSDLASAKNAAAAGGPAPAGLWNPRTAKPLLEHYLGRPMNELDLAYEAYMKRIAANWSSPGTEE